MERLGVKPHPVKDAGGWVAEKLGRLKPNNRLLGYSPLSRVLELEGLLIRVPGGWPWRGTGPLGERLDGVDFVALGDRAQDQRARLEDMRRRAAVEAFSGTAGRSALVGEGSPSLGRVGEDLDGGGLAAADRPQPGVRGIEDRARARRARARTRARAPRRADGTAAAGARSASRSTRGRPCTCSSPV